MILWIKEKDRHQTVLLHRHKATFQILGRDVLVLFHQGGYYLRLPRGLSADSNGPFNHETVIHIKDEFETVTISCSAYDHNYAVFHKYQWSEDLLTLGSSIDDDFYLQDQTIRSHQFVFDRRHHIVIDRYHQDDAIMDECTLNQNSFHNGSVFRVNNIQIILHEDFLMVNSVENLYIHALRYHPQEGVLPKIAPPVTLQRTYRTTPKQAEYTVNLLEPLPFSDHQRNPLIFMMGPALTMSSASMAVGLLSAYNGWLNGRELIELLPSVLLPFVMVISTLLWNPLQRLYDRIKERSLKKRRFNEYMSYLAHLEEDINEYQNALKNEMEEIYPLAFAESDRIYAALSQEREFSAVRFGTGYVPFHIHVLDQNRWHANDPIPEKIQELKDKYATMILPVVYSLHDYERISISCPTESIPFLMDAFFQFLYRTGYDLAKVIILCEPAHLQRNPWLKEIPHTILNKELRLIATTLTQVQEIACALNQNPVPELFIISLKDSLLDPLNALKAHRIHWSYHNRFLPDSDLRISYEDSHVVIDDGRIQKASLPKDVSNDPWAMAALLNHYRFEADTVLFPSANTIYDLYHITDARALHIEERWKQNRTKDSIQSVFAISADGEPMVLDLHESVHGPHGLIAGMTGSGKSELIISFLLGLCISYSPRELNFVMIDFKGGGAAQVFANQSYTVPHVAGVLSNLDSDGMERALVSFQNECHRREVLFQKMSDLILQPVMNLSSYQKYWNPDLKLPYIATLVIIVDEFAELKKERPDFMRDLISVARVGRSLGMHMILATQKPSGVVDEQIWSNTRFKICLKVQEKQDSIEMIHSQEASWIRNPGEFYVLCDGMLSHGLSGYANAPVNHHPSAVELLSCMARSEKEIRFHQDSHRLQAQEIIHEILEAGREYSQASSLWYPPLKPLYKNAMEQTGTIQLGRIDDYYHHAQPVLTLQDSLMAVFSIDRKEKCRFFLILLYELIETASVTDEAFVIDDLSACDETFSQWPLLCGVIQSWQTEKLLNLFSHLEERNGNETGWCTLIITDTPTVYEAHESIRTRLHRLIEQADRLKIRIFLFFTSASSVSARDLSLIHMRIALKNENTQDLSGIFECAVRKTVHNEYTALIFRKHMLEVGLLRILPKDIQERIKRFQIDFPDVRQPYAIPCLPEHVVSKDYKGEGIALGMNIASYEWKAICNDEMLIVLSTYEEETYAFVSYLKHAGAILLIHPEENVLMNKCNEGTGGIAIMTMDEYQSLLSKPKSVPILYIGSGFSEQYRFHISYRQPLHDNNGVFLERGKNQVLQICES